MNSVTRMKSFMMNGDDNEDERLESNPLVKSAVRAGAVWQD